MTERPRLINTYDQLRAEHDRVPGVWLYAISYHAHDRRRMQPSAWSVWCTMPGNRHFTELRDFVIDWPVRANKERVLAEAIDWLALHHLYAPVWARNRMGDWLDETINAAFPLERQRRLQATKEAP